MTVQPTPPPSISPAQMTLLRIVATMAWSDGHLADEEVEVMLNHFSRLFSSDADQQGALQVELRDYVMQNIPLDELVPQLTSAEERELVLKLGYQVISASARTPEEALINQEEAEAYRRLVSLLGLDNNVVKRIEQENSQTTLSPDNLIAHVVTELRRFLQR